MLSCYLYKVLIISVLSFISCFGQANGQEEERRFSFAKNLQFAGTPVNYNGPLTSFGFGSTGIVSLHFKNQDIANDYPSNLGININYTLNKQLLIDFPFEIYLRDNNFKLYGEINHKRHHLTYFGYGNNDFEPAEDFDANFTKLEMNGLYAITSVIYGGLRVGYENYNLIQIDSLGRLATQDIAGNRDANYSGIGLVFNYESRDNIFNPREGTFIETAFFRNDPRFGSSLTFSTLLVDFRNFWTIGTQHVLGINAVVELSGGDVPFTHLPKLGGPNLLRGYFIGQYRDKELAVMQAEYRLPIWNRVGMTFYGGVGAIALKLGDINRDILRYSYGLGIRFMVNQQNRINLRLDWAMTPESSNFYFTLGEAF